MDEGLKNYLGEKFKELGDRSLQEHEATRGMVTELTAKVEHTQAVVGHLWKKVEGSDPPPPPNGKGNSLSLPPLATREIGVSKPTKKAIRDQITDHDMDLQGMHGQLIAANSQITEIKDGLNIFRTQVVTKDDFSYALKALDVQTRAMGISPTKQGKVDGRSVGQRFTDFIAWMVREREGQKFVLSAFAALTGLITAIGTTYAIVTGRLPLPNQTAPIHYVPETFSPPTRSLPEAPQEEKSSSSGRDPATTSAGGI
jgi:hypothetical protein